MAAGFCRALNGTAGSFDEFQDRLVRTTTSSGSSAKFASAAETFERFGSAGMDGEQFDQATGTWSGTDNVFRGTTGRFYVESAVSPSRFSPQATIMASGIMQFNDPMTFSALEIGLFTTDGTCGGKTLDGMSSASSRRRLTTGGTANSNGLPWPAEGSKPAQCTVSHGLGVSFYENTYGGYPECLDTSCGICRANRPQVRFLCSSCSACARTGLTRPAAGEWFLFQATWDLTARRFTLTLRPASATAATQASWVYSSGEFASAIESSQEVVFGVSFDRWWYGMTTRVRGLRVWSSVCGAPSSTPPASPSPSALPSPSVSAAAASASATSTPVAASASSAAVSSSASASAAGSASATAAAGSASATAAAATAPASPSAGSASATAVAATAPASPSAVPSPAALECTQLVQPPLGFEYGNTSAQLREAAGGGISVELRAVDVIASLATAATLRDVTSLTLFCGVERTSSAASAFPPPVGSFIDARELVISGYPAPGGTLAAAMPLPGASSLGLCIREVDLPVSAQQLLLCIDAALRADAIISSPSTNGPSSAADCLKAVSVAAGVKLDLPARASHLEITPPVRVLADECGASVTSPGNFSVTWMDESQPLACVATSSEMRGCEGRAVFELRCLSTSPHYEIGGTMALPAGPQGGGRIVTATRDATGKVKVVAIVTTAGAVADLSGDYAIGMTLDCVYTESDARRSTLCGGSSNTTTLVEFSARNMVAGCAVAEFQLRTHSSSTSAPVVVSASGAGAGAGEDSPLVVPVTLSAAVSCVNTFTARESPECQVVTVSLIFFEPDGAMIAAELFAATSGATLPPGSFLTALGDTEWSFSGGNVTVTITPAHLVQSGFPGETAAVGVLIGTRLSVNDALFEATGSLSSSGGGGGGGSSSGGGGGSGDGFVPTNGTSGGTAPLGSRRLQGVWASVVALPGFVGSAADGSTLVQPALSPYFGTDLDLARLQSHPLVSAAAQGSRLLSSMSGGGRALAEDIEQAYSSTTASLAVAGTVDVEQAVAASNAPAIPQEIMLGLVAAAGALAGCVAAAVYGKLSQVRVVPLPLPSGAVQPPAVPAESEVVTAQPQGKWTASRAGGDKSDGEVREASSAAARGTGSSAPKAADEAWRGAEDGLEGDETLGAVPGPAWGVRPTMSHALSMRAFGADVEPIQAAADGGAFSSGWLMSSNRGFEFPQHAATDAARDTALQAAATGSADDGERLEGRSGSRQRMVGHAKRSDSETLPQGAADQGRSRRADDASDDDDEGVESFGSLDLEHL